MVDLEAIVPCGSGCVRLPVTALVVLVFCTLLVSALTKHEVPEDAPDEVVPINCVETGSEIIIAGVGFLFSEGIDIVLAVVRW